MAKRSPDVFVTFVIAFAVFVPVRLEAAEPQPDVRQPARMDTSPPLRFITPPAPVRGPLREAVSGMPLPNRAGSSGPSGPDPVLQSLAGEFPAPLVLSSFEGISNRDNSQVYVEGVPPDTNGDVGPNHYVQTLNWSLAIYDKAGRPLYGPVPTNTLWQGLGGPCQNTNDGDPIVLYDQQADRWFISQFALPNYPSGPFHQCIAVSATPEPLGSWYRYDFLYSDTKLNDYPKFGVWPDGYYMSVNQFTSGAFGFSWGGQGAVVFERDKMLTGLPAHAVTFDLYSTDSNLGGMLPSDWEGSTPPPAGSPNYFIEVDDAWRPLDFPQDAIRIWQFRVNWLMPSASTFSQLAVLTTAPFDSNLCDYSRNCISQPGGVKVDALSDRLMYRLQYRNLAFHQSLVVNHTVDVDGNDHAGIRWYELRDAGEGWQIHQQGTYAPAGPNRWMASMAMNKWGDIALGYSVSSDTVHPSVKVTGRIANDAPGVMTVGEGTLFAGSGYQESTSGRWGNYSAMAVDPDDYTFWYIQEYYSAPSTAGWHTRISSFQLSPISCTSAADCEVMTCDPGHCTGGKGEDRMRCGAASSCESFNGDDELDCMGPGSSCDGGRGDDGMRCSGGGRCVGNHGDDELQCASASFCSGESGGDVLNCTGPGSVCMGGGGEDDLTCGRGATCDAGDGDDTLTCDADSVCIGGGGSDSCRDTSGASRPCDDDMLPHP